MPVITLNATVTGYLQTIRAGWAATHNAIAADIVQINDAIFLINADWGAGLFYVGRGEYVFDLTGLTGIISSATLRIWLKRPAHGSEDDLGQTTLYVVEGVNTGVPGVADYGLLLPHTILGSAGIPYGDVLVGGSYHDIALNANGISWLTMGALSALAIRVKGDIDNSLPTGLNDVDVLGLTSAKLASLILDYNPVTVPAVTTLPATGGL